MLASRSGVHPVVYVHTRTDAQLGCDTAAWIQSWAFPATMLMGGVKGKGSGRPSPGGAPGPRRGKWDWVKPPRSSRWAGQQVQPRQNWMDFDEWDRPETVERLEASMRGAVNEKRRPRRGR